MATIMYNVGKERFGLEEVQQKQQQSTGHRNRRQQKRASIRRDLRQLSKRYRVAPEEERAALAELRQGIRERLKILNRAERSRKRRKERARARARFTANPFQFTSKLLGKKSSGKLLAEKAEVENHLKEVHSDEKRDEELPEQPKLIQVCEPEHIFDESEPTAKEVRDVIRKARAASAPGPNGIPYKVYKTFMETYPGHLEKRSPGRQLESGRGLLHPQGGEFQEPVAVPNYITLERRREDLALSNG